jgi:hypothetical protein
MFPKGLPILALPAVLADQQVQWRRLRPLDPADLQHLLGLLSLSLLPNLQDPLFLPGPRDL